MRLIEPGWLLNNPYCTWMKRRGRSRALKKRCSAAKGGFPHSLLHQDMALGTEPSRVLSITWLEIHPREGN
ncbi:MAG: hypothetical protein F6J98_35775 [Moorea sp. SIO4G2]|nr:hypothetical protein [Moorena sp. SIO4G2]